MRPAREKVRETDRERERDRERASGHAREVRGSNIDSITDRSRGAHEEIEERKEGDALACAKWTHARHVPRKSVDEVGANWKSSLYPKLRLLLRVQA